MPPDLSIDFLIVSPHDAPPPAPDVARALASAGLGAFEYAPAGAPVDTAPLSGRRRAGTFTGAVPGTSASARLLVWVYDGAVTTGMGEAAFAALTRGLDPGDTATLRDGKVALDLRIAAPEEHAARALAWATGALRVLLDVTGGACIDPAAQCSYGRREVAALRASDPLAHVAFHDEAWDPETRWIHTHGLQKLGRPELELLAVPASLRGEATSFLREVAASLAGGARLAPGGEVDMAELGSVVALPGSADADHQAPFGRLRLVDAPRPGEPEGDRATRLLAHMVFAAAAQHLQTGRLEAASDDVERLLAADPEDGAALLLKARILLRSGRAAEALDLGEFMELRVPGDYRGPLMLGEALAALGRPREALNALQRAVELEPEAAEAYAARAEIYERLGEQRSAAMDRAHAAYLARAAH